ncbi:hypothetical protein FJT64_022657 [Amphibalanus amphitrite]|uniref:Uncharacterized protein n=1 Tax=Amphibalanus amphitrite TaxID=1232801 RepID=A0A6A4WI87_AMPAM|nr:hypothetical protein FJT64_022657 [Amphibalanus amphitrite]
MKTEVTSLLTHGGFNLTKVPREPKGPVIVPRPVSSAAAESPARAQPAATPAQEVATDTAPTDTETAEADAATEEQPRDAVATEEQTRDAEEQPAQATAGARRDSVELPPQAPLRRSSRPRASAADELVHKLNARVLCRILLKERFARPAAIIFAHIEKLLKLGSKDEKELKMIQDELR